MKNTEKLSNLQLELIKLFNYELDESQLREIRALLTNYFASQTTQAMDQFMDEQQLGDDAIEMWTKEHLRRKK